MDYFKRCAAADSATCEAVEEVFKEANGGVDVILKKCSVKSCEGILCNDMSPEEFSSAPSRCSLAAATVVGVLLFIMWLV